MAPSTKYPRLPRTPTERLQIARDPASVDSDPNLYEKTLPSLKSNRLCKLRVTNQTTVLYLAYGSNLSVETFRGNRGIEPISQVNVYAPDLRLTFDLAGIPYTEPCFSGTQYRTKDSTNAMDRVCGDNNKEEDIDEEKADLSLVDLESRPLYERQEEYHKDRWHKPLVGSVYEVTLEDYARIIATEGAGSGYKDIVVPCFPFPKAYNPKDPTPDEPATEPFMAHTLLSPSKSDYKRNSHLARPVPSYAQPSARYLKLLMDGASELDFPHDYRAYLASIRPYRVTTWGQSVAQKIVSMTILPILMLLLWLVQLFSNDEGIAPVWLRNAQVQVHENIWKSYDGFFRKTFGDGERTIGDV